MLYVVLDASEILKWNEGPSWKVIDEIIAKWGLVNRTQIKRANSKYVQLERVLQDVTELSVD